jgi:hypothetical protein
LLKEEDGAPDDDLPPLDRDREIGSYGAKASFALVLDSTFERRRRHRRKARSSDSVVKSGPQVFKVWLGESESDYCSLLWQDALSIEQVLGTVAKKQVARASNFVLQYADAPEKGSCMQYARFAFLTLFFFFFFFFVFFFFSSSGALPLGATLGMLGDSNTEFRFVSVETQKSLEKRARRASRTGTVFQLPFITRAKSIGDLHTPSKRPPSFVEVSEAELGTDEVKSSSKARFGSVGHRRGKSIQDSAESRAHRTSDDLDVVGTRRENASASGPHRPRPRTHTLGEMKP